MNDITFIHSLNTKPMLEPGYGMDGLHRLLSQVWYFSLSVAYLKRMGAYVVLHTDSLGKAVLGHLPYDRVCLSFDNMPGGISPRFWAAGKFVALQREHAPCLHLDGDVFLKQPQCLERIKGLMESNEVLTQSMDAAIMYSLEKPFFEKEKDFCAEHHCLPDGEDAFNTGILGFSSDRAKDLIVGNYCEVAKYFSEKYADELAKGEFLTPDLIAEQKMIQGICRDLNLSNARLLTNPQQAVGLGYQHVYTLDKMNSLPQCRETLKAIDPDIYHRTMKVAGEFTPKMPDYMEYDTKNEEQ